MRLVSAEDVAGAPVFDLLETYVAFVDDAKLLAERGHATASRVARENAEAIAAEIERRCVR